MLATRRCGSRGRAVDARGEVTPANEHYWCACATKVASLTFVRHASVWPRCSHDTHDRGARLRARCGTRTAPPPPGQLVGVRSAVVAASLVAEARRGATRGGGAGRRGLDSRRCLPAGAAGRRRRDCKVSLRIRRGAERGGARSVRQSASSSVDLVGSTARAAASDQEDVRALLRVYHERARDELESFGGTVEKFIDDAVVAVFGAAVSHEDDPERAVRGALNVREAVARLNDDESGRDLHVRIAVNTGEALVSLDAAPAEGEAMVAGDVVNTAARLQLRRSSCPRSHTSPTAVPRRTCGGAVVPATSSARSATSSPTTRTSPSRTSLGSKPTRRMS